MVTLSASDAPSDPLPRRCRLLPARQPRAAPPTSLNVAIEQPCRRCSWSRKSPRRAWFTADIRRTRLAAKLTGYAVTPERRLDLFFRMASCAAMRWPGRPPNASVRFEGCASAADPRTSTAWSAPSGHYRRDCPAYTNVIPGLESVVLDRHPERADPHIRKRGGSPISCAGDRGDRQTLPRAFAAASISLTSSKTDRALPLAALCKRANGRRRRVRVRVTPPVFETDELGGVGMMHWRMV